MITDDLITEFQPGYFWQKKTIVWVKIGDLFNRSEWKLVGRRIHCLRCDTQSLQRAGWTTDKVSTPQNYILPSSSIWFHFNILEQKIVIYWEFKINHTLKPYYQRNDRQQHHFTSSLHRQFISLKGAKKDKQLKRVKSSNFHHSECNCKHIKARFFPSRTNVLNF